MCVRGRQVLSAFYQPRKTISMKTKFNLTLAVLAGAALGAVAIQGLNAQGKSLAYYVSEIQVTDPAVYQTYLDKNTPLIESMGGRFLSRGGKIVAHDGMPPQRFAIAVFDSMEKAQAYRYSATYKEIIPDRDKSSKFRSFTAEGTVSGTLEK
jgi:uncharacterized protein (DUF1330 family)